MTQPDREQQVGRAFVALADTLVDDYDVIELLNQLVRHCVELLAAEAAGILLGDGCGELHAVAASSDDAETMELLQLQSAEGPCLDCYWSGSRVSVPDLDEVAERWPGFSAAADRAGTFRSVHALPLRLRGQAIGALNLFHRDPRPLPQADLDLGQALADVATIGILQERSIHRTEVMSEQLTTALAGRVLIEQAKGVVAQNLGLSMEAAFDRLRHHARHHNLRLGELAREIVGHEYDPGGLMVSAPGGQPRAGHGRRSRPRP